MKKKKQQRKGEILFIDARNMGYLINRRTRDLECRRHQPNSPNLQQLEIPSVEGCRRAGLVTMMCRAFAKSATLAEVKALNYALTPGRYAGLAEEKTNLILLNALLRLKQKLEKQIAKRMR
jgi:type I restriction enzyme M protein